MQSREIVFGSAILRKSTHSLTQTAIRKGPLDEVQAPQDMGGDGPSAGAPQQMDLQLPTHRHYGHSKEHPVHFRHRNKSADPLHKEEDKLVAEWKDIAEDMSRGNVDPQAQQRLEQINQRLKQIQDERHSEAMEVIGERLGEPEDVDGENMPGAQSEIEGGPPVDENPIARKSYEPSVMKGQNKIWSGPRKVDLSWNGSLSQRPIMSKAWDGSTPAGDTGGFGEREMAPAGEGRSDPGQTTGARCPRCSGDDVDNDGVCPRCGHDTFSDSTCQNCDGNGCDDCEYTGENQNLDKAETVDEDGFPLGSKATPEEHRQARVRGRSQGMQVPGQHRARPGDLDYEVPGRKPGQRGNFDRAPGLPKVTNPDWDGVSDDWDKDPYNKADFGVMPNKAPKTPSMAPKVQKPGGRFNFNPWGKGTPAAQGYDSNMKRAVPLPGKPVRSTDVDPNHITNKPVFGPSPSKTPAGRPVPPSPFNKSAMKRAATKCLECGKKHLSSTAASRCTHGKPALHVVKAESTMKRAATQVKKAAAELDKALAKKSVDRQHAIMNDLVRLASELEKAAVSKSYVRHGEYWCPADRVHKSSDLRKAHESAVSKDVSSGGGYGGRPPRTNKRGGYGPAQQEFHQKMGRVVNALEPHGEPNGVEWRMHEHPTGSGGTFEHAHGKTTHGENEKLVNDYTKTRAYKTEQRKKAAQTGAATKRAKKQATDLGNWMANPKVAKADDDNPFELQDVGIYPRGGGSDSAWKHRQNLDRKAGGKVRVSASGWDMTPEAQALVDKLGHKQALAHLKRHIPQALAIAAHKMVNEGKDSHGRPIDPKHHLQMPGEEPVKANWSQYASCSCGCSPAFVAHNVRSPYDVSMRFGVSGHSQPQEKQMGRLAPGEKAPPSKNPLFRRGE